MRQLEIAHRDYFVDSKEYLIEANLAHGGIVHVDTNGNPIAPWFGTLKTYTSDQVAVRSPLDDSPHWGQAPAGRSEGARHRSM